MVNLTRIYTRTGDDGTTSLGDMSRTTKTDLRLEAYADVDEANSCAGVALASGGLDDDIIELLAAVQNDSGGFVYEHEVILRAVAAGLRIASVPVSTTPSTSSHVTAREMLRANNHFARRVLALLGSLPLPLWRRALLGAGCAAGLAVGVPAAWALGDGRRASR